MSDNRHFDCLKNKLPDNWTNSNATGYYNRAFWKRCKCEYGTKNPCKETADKWNPVATEPDKWTKGCSPCSSYYSRPPSYFYTYNPNDCGDCGGRCKCKEHCPPPPCDTDDDCCRCEGSKWNVFSNRCNKCHKNYKREDCQSNASCHPLKSYVYKSGCDDCQDVAIVYRMINEERDCDNIVELKIPVGGSKERYMAYHFSPEFVDANIYQCATVPAYNGMQNNFIDNMREEEFTISDQAALVKRGIKNALFAKQLMEEGKLIHEKHDFSIPMNVNGRTSYYYFGNQFTSGSTGTGLVPQDSIKGYFV